MNVKKILSEMTLEEKAGLCSGSDFWHTKAIERLGVPEVMVSDGPHGLRSQDQNLDNPGINDSIKAVCFPASCAMAASFDRKLIYEMGEAIGDECQHENISTILGPAVNIKRSPLCGRNFEYFSEDPYLATEMATNHIKGVQSKNIGTSMKHFLANNQEHRRMSTSSEIDERTLREIYLAAFEGAVKNAKPWTIMCSYNGINGTLASENKKYLTDILRGEWGFDGYVMSDWGAVNDRIKGIEAGLDLEMPGSNGVNDSRIVRAVKEGILDEKIVDQAAERILNIIYRYIKNRQPDTKWDMEAHHELARKIEGECMVLLKNEGILPLKKGSRIAFIGEFAGIPRYQGGGSSYVNSFKIVSAMSAADGIADITYAQGYGNNEDIINEELISKACEVAKSAEVAVIFAGLPDSFESEGYDRIHMSIPNCQNELIKRIAKIQPNTVIVLHNGSPIEMPWAEDVKGILEAYLGGQAVGEACVDVLFGDVNPSGKLPETFPRKLQDSPSYLYYGGEGDKSEYREGVFVGYRYYDKKDMDVLFPFGYGLSYTTFNYSNLKLSSKEIKDTDILTVSVDVTNTGDKEGKEIVELYVGEKESNIIRPLKELRGFEKVSLKPGEMKTVTFILTKRAFSYYNTEIKDWYAESGDYQILIGKSSRDIVLNESIYVEASRKLPFKLTVNTTFGDLLERPEAVEELKSFIDLVKVSMGEQTKGKDQEKSVAISDDMNIAMLKYMPIRGILSFGDGSITYDKLTAMLDDINKKLY
ncbi:glycoside hydrolase family 3 C-terminal domain-containing protein [Clostridium bowmanii]|uniref:glycoside hydrolase family 3 C-terminal domain-containing protein n=1 Tax=Clostridium bowmanii TaxID=132925 RepID=UPI001C0B23CE|nr:glycoside hydrolase family 3 C-terminal domain-containing protein [Clostridium bowmanii]MBU3188824.1 glycoside hydrolase family 3 C-terminal domain-containing protein [Clostridium bowmanii]MCA1073407.1 glycoside hydrolase family 3 C-terminal domain-containing protein [Clostridium bowmanii]